MNQQLSSHERMLLENKAWAAEQVRLDPQFFERLVNIQQPEFLWIGCSDSRVPANQITNTAPGEVFVHRNIANMVVHTDLNLLSVLQYAVEVLKVKHVIVCGHYNCGGVKAAMGRGNLGIINKWLRNIKDVYRYHQEEVDAEPTEEARVNKMVELNVQEQVLNLAKTSIIQKAWHNEQRPLLHGWVYDLHDGVLKPISQMGPGSDLGHPIYHYENF